MGDNEAGPSRSISNTRRGNDDVSLSPRRREKAPIRRTAISLNDVRLDDTQLDRVCTFTREKYHLIDDMSLQDIALLISQYLDNHHSSLARRFDEEVLGQAQDDLREEEIREVERAILGEPGQT